MDFDAILTAFAESRSEPAMQALIDRARNDGLSDDELARLARVLAHSGATLSLPSTVTATDIPSTGGPGSLSTLISPLFLVALGCAVPKLAVTGRPAGGIDVMAQVPFYRITLSGTDVLRIIERCRYAHFLATTDHAPLDARLFDYRRKTGTVNVPALAIASLLAKKLAVGLAKVGLEVRVAPHGNFGGTWTESRANAARFCKIARIVGIDAICFLTDASRPYQPFVGRGEALMALAQLLEGKQGPWLEQHVRMCFAMARSVAGADSLSLPTKDQIIRAFAANLEAQGSNLEMFFDCVRHISEAPRSGISAQKSGYLVIDLTRIRGPLVKLQDDFKTTAIPYPDPAGVVFAKNTGDYVHRGEVVASVRCDSLEIRSELAQAFHITHNPGAALGFEEVRNA